MKTHKQWMEFFWNNFSLPIIVDYDNEYYTQLKKKYSDLISGLSILGAPQSILDPLKEFVNEITNAIQEYYRGNIIQAHEKIQIIFKKCCENNQYAISGINESPAFSRARNSEISKVDFYRARLNENIIDYSSKDMLHIPFKERSKVKSERFSIPGLPCLYLGNTSYVCWIELGCPADHRFNVSPVRLDNSQKIFNLAIYKQLLQYILDSGDEDDNIEHNLLSVLKILMINLATSFVVKEENRNFKSEYLVSQMLMIACKNEGYDGITYFSKQVKYEILATTIGVNLVLFADYNGESELSKICDHIKVGDSFNFSMFKHLVESQKYCEYSLQIDSSPYQDCIGSFKRKIPYRETDFYYFDKYLFAKCYDEDCTFGR